MAELFLKVALAILSSAALLFLREPGVKALLKSFGLGTIPLFIWIVTIAVILWQSRWSSIVKYWNYWVGALIFSAALLGVMALFRPEITITGISLADKTLAGYAGQFILGTSWEWAHLLTIVLIGTVFVIPRHSLNFVRGAIRYIRQVCCDRIPPLAIGALRLTRRFFVWLFSITRLLWGKVAARLRSKPVAQEAPVKEKPAKKSAKTPLPEIKEPMPEMAEELLEKPAKRRKAKEGALALNLDLPPIGLLDEAPQTSFAQANDDERGRLIEEALASYGVEVKVLQINPGPSVTQFGLEPGWVRKYKKVIEKDQYGKPKLDKNGVPKTCMEEVSKTRVKVERITALANDLALALAVSDIRIEAPMPGKALVGIEVPNISTAIVSLRNVIESPTFKKVAIKSKLALALGQGAGGEAAVGDLAKMPHILIAGATGSGKTVCLNCIVSCLLAQTTPEEVRLLLIDPKRVEMVTFNDVPHLITPVVVEADKAVDSLRRLTMEMDIRYRKFASVGARNIDSYNQNPKVTEPLPYVVTVIDELADLMMTAPDVVEPLICRLAQLSRATGIHLVVATQRPSVDVITGLIKANFPTRISFAVVSSIDSRTILDAIGAEKLLGRGDMLYVPPEASKPRRIRGCFVSDEEMERLVRYWKEWAAKNFTPEADHVAREFATLPLERLDIDPLLDKARQLCVEASHVSASLLQRKLHIGYQRAARIMEQLEEEGLLESGESDDDFDKPWGDEP